MIKSIRNFVWDGLNGITTTAATSFVLSNLNSSTSKITQVAIGAFGTGAYMSYKGMKCLLKGEYKKGSRQFLTGVCLLIGGGVLVASSTDSLEKKITSNELLTFADDKLANPSRPGAIVTLPKEICPFAISIFAAAGWAAFHQKTNQKFKCEETPMCLQIEKAETEGREFAKQIQDALKNGATLKRLDANSGIYVIKKTNNQHLAIFKPNDERAGGPYNPTPQMRFPDHSSEQIKYLELGGTIQGNSDKRQHLAKLVDHGKIAPLPKGAIVEIYSDAFVDLVAEQNGFPPRQISKRGYLQEWVNDSKPFVNDHPAAIAHYATSSSILPKEIFLRFEDHPGIDHIPLDDFQKFSIHNILLYNQDNHLANFLFKKDENGMYHLTPIDMESILPWKLNHLIGISSHQRAKEPFTKEALRYIRELNPDVVKRLIDDMNLSEQAGVNGKALAIVLRKFSAANLTIEDIHKFVTDPQSQDGSSQLWRVMQRAKQTAIKSVNKEDRGKYQYFEYVKRCLWEDGGKDLKPNSRSHLEHYQRYEEKRITNAIDQFFWSQFNLLLRQEIKNRVKR